MSSRNMSLYFIKDRASGLMYSNFIPAQNDLVAVFGFTNTLKKQEEAPIPIDPKCFALYKAAEFDELGCISALDSPVLIVTGDKAKEYYDNELVKALEAEEAVD